MNDKNSGYMFILSIAIIIVIVILTSWGKPKFVTQGNAQERQEVPTADQEKIVPLEIETTEQDPQPAEPEKIPEPESALKYETFTIPGFPVKLTGLTKDGKPTGYAAGITFGITTVVEFDSESTPTLWYDFFQPDHPTYRTGQIEVGKRNEKGEKIGTWWTCIPGQDLYLTTYKEGDPESEPVRTTLLPVSTAELSSRYQPYSVVLDGVAINTGHASIVKDQLYWDGLRGAYIPELLIVGRHEKSPHFIGDAITVTPLPSSGSVIVSIFPRDHSDLEQGKGTLIKPDDFVGHGYFKDSFPVGEWVRYSKSGKMTSKLKPDLHPIGEFTIEKPDGSTITGELGKDGKPVRGVKIVMPDGTTVEGK